MNKFIIPQFRRRLRAFTLIEIAIVIAIITLLALGIAQSATYFRTAANKSLCIVIQKQIQDAMRSIQNLDNMNVGDTQDSTQGISLDTALYGTPSAFFPVKPACPGNGVLTIGDAITGPGTAIATCTGTGHAPTSTQVASW